MKILIFVSFLGVVYSFLLSALSVPALVMFTAMLVLFLMDTFYC